MEAASGVVIGAALVQARVRASLHPCRSCFDVLGCTRRPCFWQSAPAAFNSLRALAASHRSTRLAAGPRGIVAFCAGAGCAAAAVACWFSFTRDRRAADAIEAVRRTLKPSAVPARALLRSIDRWSNLAIAMQAIALAEEDVRALDSSEAAQLPTIGEPVSPEASPEASPRRTMQFIQSHERRMRERLRAAGEKDATGESSSGITRKVRASPRRLERVMREARALSQPSQTSRQDIQQLVLQEMKLTRNSVTVRLEKLMAGSPVCRLAWFFAHACRSALPGEGSGDVGESRAGIRHDRHGS